jgi:hypothetical protein
VEPAPDHITALLADLAVSRTVIVLPFRGCADLL